MKKTRKIISLLLTIQMLLACALIPGVMATDAITDLPVIEGETIEELSPMAANECTVYQNESIGLQGNEPNATYYYTSTGTSGGIIFSIAFMDNYGRTTYREDLRSYNGQPLHHGTITGPHSHTYTWTTDTNSQNQTFHRIIAESIAALS